MSFAWDCVKRTKDCNQWNQWYWYKVALVKRQNKTQLPTSIHMYTYIIFDFVLSHVNTIVILFKYYSINVNPTILNKTICKNLHTLQKQCYTFYREYVKTPRVYVCFECLCVCNVVINCYISEISDTFWMFKECYLNCFLYSVCWSQKSIVYKVFTNNKACEIYTFGLKLFWLLLCARIKHDFFNMIWCQVTFKLQDVTFMLILLFQWNFTAILYVSLYLNLSI